MRYCTFLYVKRLQKYQRSKLEVDKELPTRPDSSSMRPQSGCYGRFFSTSNFDLWYFCSLLTYKDVQYLIWKIWFIFDRRMKARAMAWLSMWFMFAQNTLISYHTEAFVKTKVACTVLLLTFIMCDFFAAFWMIVPWWFVKLVVSKYLPKFVM